MSEFFVGQKVVYVGGRHNGKDPREVSGSLTKGAVYTVRWIGVIGFYVDGRNEDQVALKVMGFSRKFKGSASIFDDYPTAAESFRPLVTKAISIFRKIARDVTEGKKVEIDA